MSRVPPSDEVLDHEELRYLELDFIEELMSQPPGGHNHGRKQTEGGWSPLETDPIDIPSWKRDPVPTPHATDYAYRKLRCRCEICRAWKASQDRGRNR